MSIILCGSNQGCGSGFNDSFEDQDSESDSDPDPAAIFYLDFAKAFDKVQRERIIIKLEAKGITGRLKNWIREWLTGRTQVVVVQGAKSEQCEVDSGVTQGTVLGPPLFTIHIDDIDDFAFQQCFGSVMTLSGSGSSFSSECVKIKEKLNVAATFTKMKPK
jgi:hypothetical protein